MIKLAPTRHLIGMGSSGESPRAQLAARGVPEGLRRRRRRPSPIYGKAVAAGGPALNAGQWPPGVIGKDDLARGNDRGKPCQKAAIRQ